MVGSKPDLNPPPRRERASVGFAAHNLNQILYQMSHSIILEVCVDSVESARAAVEGGADRLEICGSLATGGGVTPSYGLVKSIIKTFPTIPTMVMIRPRVGDFIYSDDEIEVMLSDIQCFKESGVSGVVIGALTSKATVDVAKTQRMVLAASPFQVTFHRAFDMTRDLDEALEALRAIRGVNRVLTSGGAPSAPDAVETIAHLMGTTGDSISIMPGSGINQHTVGNLVSSLPRGSVREVHLSGGEWKPGQAIWRKIGMGMGAPTDHEWDIWRTSANKIRAVRDVLDTL